MVKHFVSEFRQLFPRGGYWGNLPPAVASSRVRV